LLKEELLPDGDLLGGRVLERTTESDSVDAVNSGSAGADGCSMSAPIGALSAEFKTNALPVFSDLPKQDRLLNATTAICEAQFDVRIAQRFYFFPGSSELVRQLSAQLQERRAALRSDRCRGRSLPRRHTNRRRSRRRLFYKIELPQDEPNHAKE